VDLHERFHFTHEFGMFFLNQLIPQSHEPTGDGQVRSADRANLCVKWGKQRARAALNTHGSVNRPDLTGLLEQRTLQ
jgi:hypothetical protein